MKVAIVGVGNMGGAIMQGLNNLTKYDLIALNPKNPRVEKLAHEYKFKLVFDPQSLVELQPDVVILTTPAPVTVTVAEQLQALDPHTIVISAAAGVKRVDLQKALINNPVATMIPNTPVSVNTGTIGLSLNPTFDKTIKDTIVQLLNDLGDVVLVPEEQLDIVGVIGGCGPAFVDVFMDAMSDAAVKHGLNRQTAYRLIASMVKGSGALAYETRQSPAALRDQVASPAGTTIRGLAALEKHGFRYGVIDAVDKASDED